jgi:hypothetical protein
MSINRLLPALGLFLSFSAGTIVACQTASCGTAPKAVPTGSVKVSAKHYVCPMHPEVVSTRPGDCPKCGMALQETKHKGNR